MKLLLLYSTTLLLYGCSSFTEARFVKCTFTCDECITVEHVCAGTSNEDLREVSPGG